MLKYTLTLWVKTFCCTTPPFDPNESRLGPVGSNGLTFGGCPDKAPKVESGGAGFAPRWSSTPDQRVAGLGTHFIYRMRIGTLVPNFGGKGLRAEWGRER